MRHYSRRTEQTYVAWIRRFIVFHGTRHLRELGEAHVTAFVSSLAERDVSASTQNQALSAVLFLFKVVLGERLGWMNRLSCDARWRIGPLSRSAYPGGAPSRFPRKCL